MEHRLSGRSGAHHPTQEPYAVRRRVGDSMYSDREDSRPILDRRAFRERGRILRGRPAGSILWESGPPVTARALHPLAAVRLARWRARLSRPAFGLEFPLQADQLGLQCETGEDVAEDDRLASNIGFLGHPRIVRVSRADVAEAKQNQNIGKKSRQRTYGLRSRDVPRVRYPG